MLNDHETKCFSIWPATSEDTKLGHAIDTIHHCKWERDKHPTATLMAIDTDETGATDNVKIHKCACGVTWFERTQLEKRIQ
jgi:hypothetical protein